MSVTEWIIEDDGRIPCVAVIADQSATSGHYVDTVSTVFNADTIILDRGDIADLSLNRIAIRRGGKYRLSGSAISPGVMHNEDILRGQIVVNSTAVVLFGMQSSGLNQRLSVSLNKTQDLVAADYTNLQIQPFTGTNVTWDSAASRAPTLTVEEIL